ncbi:hypothetical protein LAZ67_11002144 [Cordylochernes scorpioides]|uniref:Reverse transcriptase domain-containing protein n=1 Tax=Cordylochernes scorpioides TaxID=51811 RepID=A0ABY6KYZ8_9ARAC|nr:hypothetical protein LAZ67_11002144 [Cordylochernes scorpioides]
MKTDTDYESGESTTFPKKETTLGRTQEVPPSHEDATPPPLVSDVLERLTTTRHQLSAVTGHRERWNRYDGSYEAQSFFTNYDAQADRVQLQYSTRLRKPPNLLQAPLRVTNTRASSNHGTRPGLSRHTRQHNRRQNVHDDERSGCPVTATDNAAVAAVRNVVEADSRVTIDEIMIRLPPGIEIRRSSIGTIMSDVLNFLKVCTRWVPRLLLENHNQQRMEAARAFLEMHQRDGDQLFSRIVTGDESWVHHSTPETKRQSMVWKKPEESAPKKAKVKISAGKVMAMENFKWEIFKHPPYSPELAPSDFHLYPAGGGEPLATKTGHGLVQQWYLKIATTSMEERREIGMEIIISYQNGALRRLIIVLSHILYTNIISTYSGYRPISLPTADYRIVSSVLLGRLRRHLPAIVPDCQTYAVPGRCPSWNIACVSDEVAQAFKNKTPLAVISTDLQSAFDNVDREFLASQLRIIGLPPPFMEWLHLLYAEADATIKVDGNFTRPFKMRRGLRQGCACSAALFSIFTGPLLRHLERILGRGNVLAYADDILLLIREDWQFERVKTVFDEFRRASGVSVNFPKSKGLWCGAWRDRADSPLGISWSASSITVLDCEITSGHGTSVQENHLLGILERSISRWSPFVRGFSLVGRARAANSLVLAAVLHHLHGYLPGDATIAKLQARLTRFVWGSCHRAAWLPGGLLARPVSVGGVGLLDIRTQLQLACFKGVQAASRNGGKNAYSWLVESGAWMTPLSSGSWLLPRRRRLLDLWGQASSILGLNHRVLPAPTLLNLPLVGACRFLATPSLRAPSRWRGVRVRDLAGPAPPPIARLTRSACEDAAALGAFCQRLVADNATSIYRERTLEEAVVLRGTATPFLHISTRTARRMLERPRLAAVPISRYLRRWGPVVDVPSTSLASSSLRRCSFGGHAADIALRLALHALPHPGHPASSQPVCIACGSSDLSLAHRYWSCSAVRPLIREVFSIIGRPPDLQSWIFAVNLENHAITISSAAKHAIYVFFVDREMRGFSGDPLAIFHQTLQRWQRRHVHSCIF